MTVTPTTERGRTRTVRPAGSPTHNPVLRTGHPIGRASSSPTLLPPTRLPTPHPSQDPTTIPTTLRPTDVTVGSPVPTSTPTFGSAGSQFGNNNSTVSAKATTDATTLGLNIRGRSSMIIFSLIAILLCCCFCCFALCAIAWKRRHRETEDDPEASI